MKRTSRLIVAIVLALVLTFSLLVVVACGEEGYSVTVSSYNQEGGSVSVAPPSEGELYDNNEEVTVTVTVVDGYEVTSVTANDVPCTPTADGKYTFNITADTVVKVEIAKIPEYALTINAPKTGGTVNASPAAEGEYRRGETITVTATAAEGYLLSSFKVDGEEKLTELDEQGRYVFDIAKATVIDVQFVRLVTVNVSVSPAGHADLTVTDPTHNGKFAVGESVTVEVVPEEGYELGDVYVNSNLYEGSTQPLTIPVTDNGSGEMNVEVTLRQLSQVVLDSVSGSVELKGTYTLTQGSIDLHVIYDKQAEAVLLERSQHGFVTYAHLGKNVSGTENIVTHNSTGEVTLTPTSTAFADVFNPFVNLIGDDIAAGETEHTWTVTNEADRAAILFALTRLQGTPTSVTLTEEDLQVVSITIVTENGTFAFDVENRGTATVPADYLANYQANTTLAAALVNMASATNYTVTATINATDPYNIYFDSVSQTIYSDEKGEESGLFKRVDNSLWSFTYFDEQFVTGEEAFPAARIQSLGGFGYLGASFNVASGYTKWVADLGNGVYEIRSIDCVKDSSDTTIPAQIASCFAVKTDGCFQLLAQTAGSLRITLNEAGDGIAKIEAYCLISSSINQITLEFKNVGSTVLPIVIPAEKVAADITDKYLGTFATNEGEHVLDINIGSVYLDDEVSSSVTCSDDELKFTVKGVEYTLTLTDGQGKLNGGDITDVDVYACDWVELIGEYQGFTTFEEDESTYIGKFTLKITASDIEIDGYGIDTPISNVKITNAGLYEYQGTYYAYEIDFTFNEQDYVLITRLYTSAEAVNLNCIDFYTADSKTEICTFYNDISGGTVDWSPLVGTYVYSSTSKVVRFEVTPDAVYINYNDYGWEQVIVYNYSTTDECIYFVWDGAENYFCYEPTHYHAYMILQPDGEDLWIIAQFSERIEDAIDFNYRGTWATPIGDCIVEITETNITLSGSAFDSTYQATSIQKTESGYTFDITISNVVYSCSIELTDEGRVLSLKGSQLFGQDALSLSPCDYVEFLGIWLSGTDFGYVTGEYQFIILANGTAAVYTNGILDQGTVKLLGYLPNGDPVIQITTQSGKQYQVQIAIDGIELAAFDLSTRQLTACLWLDQSYELSKAGFAKAFANKSYQGTIDETEYKVEIAEDGTVTLTEGEAPVEATEEIEYYVDFDYFLEVTRVIVQITTESKTYQIQLIPSCNYIDLYVSEEAAESHGVLYKDGTQPDYSEYNGTYTLTLTIDEKTSRVYTLVIGETITLQIDSGDAKQATIVSFDPTIGFEIVVDGTHYFVLIDTESGSLYLSDTETFYSKLTKSPTA